MAHPGLHRHQTARNGVARVVMAMDAQMIAGDMGRDLADNTGEFMGQGTAIGVAQHDLTGPGIQGRLQAGQG
jgi:hypothetical protein